MHSMALPLCECHFQILIISTSQRKRLFVNAGHIEALRLASNTSLSLPFHTVSLNTTRNHSLSSLRSASINGVSTKSDRGYFPNKYGDNDFEFRKAFRKWTHSLLSIFPGGNWWNFSNHVDVIVTEKPETVFQALSRMWGLVVQDRHIILAAFAALVMAAVSEISIPHFLTASIFSAHSAEVAVFHKNVRLLVILCITSAIFSGIRGCCFGIANMILVKRMRETLYSSLLLQDISFFDDAMVGDLTSRLGADCQQVSRLIGNDLNFILRNVLQATGALIYLLVLSWPLGLCTLAISCAVSTIMLVYGLYQKKAAKLTQQFTASANEVAQETFSLMRTVRVYGTEKQEIERYNHWLGKLADINLRQSAAFGLWNSSFNVLYHSTQVIAVVIGGSSMLAGHITAEKLTKFIMYSEWLIYSTWWIGDSVSSLMQSVGASEKVFELMDLSPSDQFLSEGLKLQNIKGNIEFVDVSFYYPSRPAVPALQHVNISIHPNEVVAFVGLSGSGKSTLVNLLLRLYEPTSGQILIDRIPLKEFDIKWVRERIGFVGQEPRLFRMDIGSNIKYGCTRDISEEDVEWAARQAYAHDFILSLPDGYKTIVDDDLLSGGQKQRIAIARAILRDPAILILDEATSALDAESEYNVKGVIRAIRNESKTRRTVLIIAHRLSTIQAADRIVVMSEGSIIEMGNHKELVSKGGLYAQLTQRQVDALT